MTAYNYLYLIAVCLVILGLGSSVYATDDVTIVAAPSSSGETPRTNTQDGTPVVHKSLHKKKKSSDVASATTTTNAASSAAPTTKSVHSDTAPTSSVVVKAAPPTAPAPSSVTVKAATPPATAPAAPSAPAKSVVAAPVLSKSTNPSIVVGPATKTLPTESNTANLVVPPPAPTLLKAEAPAGSGPEVETGLPVARNGNSVYVAGPIPTSSIIGGGTGHIPTVTSQQKTAAPYQAAMVGTIPALTPGVPPISGSAYVPPSVTTIARKPTRTYPWKTNIITTTFWIGEGGSSISSTDNIASSWDENWQDTNGGSDTNHQGYVPKHHAATVNPFYIALPFNDVAFPDKARQWVPSNWRRPPKDGKPVSACKDRWVEIKNADGRSCFAQWEDVGPLRFDHAEYVFGSERPNTFTRAGLDVSPAVAQYLNLNQDKKAITRWRFVDDEDVPPGVWLKYDEQAVIFTAMKALRDRERDRLPIQKATTPIEDPANVDSNKKKVTKAKG